jgi:hypothetical protein
MSWISSRRVNNALYTYQQCEVRSSELLLEAACHPTSNLSCNSTSPFSDVFHCSILYQREQYFLRRVVPLSDETLNDLAHTTARYVNTHGHASKILCTDIARIEHLYSMLRDPKTRTANVVPGPLDGGTALSLVHDPMNTLQAYE